MGPGRTNGDFSVFKQLPVTERMHIQFRGEFFNLFNHPQFDLPNGTIGSPSAGVISGTVGTPAIFSSACGGSSEARVTVYLISALVLAGRALAADVLLSKTASSSVRAAEKQRRTAKHHRA